MSLAIQKPTHACRSFTHQPSLPPTLDPPLPLFLHSHRRRRIHLSPTATVAAPFSFHVRCKPFNSCPQPETHAFRSAIPTPQNPIKLISLSSLKPFAVRRSTP
uniref:Uncharacterized protein n=1 Tax=Cucumis melo TaxID=3656 RepID=A0A9I9E6Z0_CUCME